MTESAYRIGDFNIQRIVETQIDFSPPTTLLPDWNDDTLREISPSIGPDYRRNIESVSTSVHSWLLRTEEKAILVDTGIGNHKKRAAAVFDNLNNPYLEHLAVAGRRPDSIDFVLITHIHTDHVGWNTVSLGGRWVPTFTKAKYFIPKVGCADFESEAGRARSNHVIYVDSVAPVIEAGLAEMVEPAISEVLPGITYIPTPGHSVDHMSILVESKGERAIIAGDILHHPAQVYQPRWNSVFCASPEQARHSRRQVLERAADSGALYLSSHLPETSAGRVTRVGDRFAWKYE